MSQSDFLLYCHRVDRFWEKTSIYIAAFLIGACAYSAWYQSSKIKNIEQRMLVVESDLASKQDISEIEKRLNKRIDNAKSDIVDILDIYLTGR